MTDSDYTALLLVIDRSGSMEAIREDMVGGLTALLREQAEEPGRMTVSVVLFDDEVKTTHRMADPADVEVWLKPRGMTALNDALGAAITEFGADLAALDEAARPGTVIVVVATDGMENSSKVWSGDDVKLLVQRQQSVYDWDFVFLGANHDAVLAGSKLGFCADSSLEFAATSEGTTNVNLMASGYISSRKRGRSAAFTDEDRRRAKA
ncbi:vWA domain-containing protein [Naasia lichenicola]|uniref:VWA domain-containing protein n=1 Tax=Naasia lichenicola TaxID=2565933 RepID=A0A4S4FRD9_9MICO|nr:vWA domain-containing protein [Naasia lichenicola]THG33203.1 VWA domain-containing protein [Naasia lichenicola]